jgi:5-methylcytosine-specific restriction endonuclease McrA
LSREKHWNWNGGITPIYRKLRRTKKYDKWRKAVYKRDNWTCQRCGKRVRSKDIIAHHIMEFRKYEKLRYEVKNGITVCRSCHLLIHKKPALWEVVKEVLERKENG